MAMDLATLMQMLGRNRQVLGIGGGYQGPAAINSPMNPRGNMGGYQGPGAINSPMNSTPNRSFGGGYNGPAAINSPMGNPNMPPPQFRGLKPFGAISPYSGPSATNAPVSPITTGYNGPAALAGPMPAPAPGALLSGPSDAVANAIAQKRRQMAGYAGPLATTNQ